MAAVLWLIGGSAAAQVPESGAAMYQAWCASCHAADGSGRVPSPTITTTPLDFTSCKLASAESDADWRVVIAHGGPAAGLSGEMPAFESLEPSRIDKLVAHLRTFCVERDWPSGNLNFPRALYTAKAYPDSELTIQPAISHGHGARTRYRLETEFEQRFGRRAHASLRVPVETLDWVTGPVTGIGDLALGGSYTWFAAANRSGIATTGFEVVFSTGSPYWGFGEGAMTFEPWLAAGTFWKSLFVQAELRAELPTHRISAEENNTHLVYNLAVSHDLSPVHTAWNIGVELNGVNNAIAITPEVRKGLTRSGALAATLGVRIPITNLYHHKDAVYRWSLSIVWDYLESKRRTGH